MARSDTRRGAFVSVTDVASSTSSKGERSVSGGMRIAGRAMRASCGRSCVATGHSGNSGAELDRGVQVQQYQRVTNSSKPAESGGSGESVVALPQQMCGRSEERRVGKDCRSLLSCYG